MFRSFIVLTLLAHALAGQVFPFPRPPIPFGGGKAIVQGCTGSNASSSITCSFGSLITAGHQLYFCAGYDTNFGGTVSWSGDSGTFHADPGSSSAISNKQWTTIGYGYYVSCSYVLSAGGGTSTITASVSGGTTASMSMSGVEMSGLTSFDQSDNGSSLNQISASLASNSITPGNNGDMLIGVCMNAQFYEALTAGTNVSWVAVPNAGLAGDPPYTFFEYYVQPTAVSVNAQCSMSAAQYWWAHIVSFH